jgi:hypothetical protein
MVFLFSLLLDHYGVKFTCFHAHAAFDAYIWVDAMLFFYIPYDSAYRAFSRTEGTTGTSVGDVVT